MSNKTPTALFNTMKIKTPQKMSAEFNHVYRHGKQPGNVDPSRADKNEELVRLPGENYLTVFRDRIEENNIKPRSNAVWALEAVMVAQDVGEDFDLEEWKKRSTKWVQDCFGKDNVVSVVFHGDESQPHIHALVIPIVDGRLNCSYYTDGRDRLTEMQTAYAESVKDLGLERGVEGSQIKFTDMQTYRAASVATVKEKLPSPERGETAEAYARRAQKTYTEMRASSFKRENDIAREAQIQINEHKKAREAAEKAKETAEMKVQPLTEENAELREENRSLRKELAKLSDDMKAEQRRFANYLTNGITQERLLKLDAFEKIESALNRNLVTGDKKASTLNLMKEALQAYDKAERERGELLDDRELSETELPEFEEFDVTDD